MASTSRISSIRRHTGMLKANRKEDVRLLHKSGNFSKGKHLLVLVQHDDYIDICWRSGDLDLPLGL